MNGKKLQQYELVPSISRDKYKKNTLSGLLQPNIERKRDQAREYFMHDKLNVADIDGTQVDTYGRQGQYAMRDRNLNPKDIEGTSPNIFPGNKYKNKPDLRFETKDLDYPLKTQFSTNRVTDPLNPTY